MENLFSNLPSRKYQLFISHDWEYTDEYERVQRLLNTDVTFHWENLSVTIENPIPSHPTLPKSHWTICRELIVKIERADCLLVLAGMYVNYSGWIQSEIQLAQEFHKPIIAVKRWGQERVPEALQRVSVCEPVWCATGPLIFAIRRYTAPEPQRPRISRVQMAAALSPPGSLIPTGNLSTQPRRLASLLSPPSTGLPSLGSSALSEYGMLLAGLQPLK
jgi:hypothetical protein